MRSAYVAFVTFTFAIKILIYFRKSNGKLRLNSMLGIWVRFLEAIVRPQQLDPAVVLNFKLDPWFLLESCFQDSKNLYTLKSVSLDYGVSPSCQAFFVFAVSLSLWSA